MDISSFLQIGIVGVALSTVVQVIKTQFGTDSLATKGITLFLAVILGAVVYFLWGTPVFAAIVGVLGVASTFYAFFLK